MSTDRLWVLFGLCVLTPAPAGAQLAVLSLVDSAGDVGKQSAVAFGSDGLPLIAYYDATNGDLKIAHCVTVDCTFSTKSLLDSAGDVGSEPAIAIGADGLGIVAYRDVTAGAVKVAHCADLSCSSASIATLGASTALPRGIAIVIGNDDLPLVAYTRSDSRFLFAHCLDPVCSSSTVVVSNWGGTWPSLAVPPDGRPLLLQSGFDLRLNRCVDPSCTDFTGLASLPGSLPPPAGGFGSAVSYSDASMVVGPGGQPVVVATRRVQDFIPHAQPVRYTTVMLRCFNTQCSFLSGPTIATGVFEPALALAPNGTALVAQQNQPSNGSLPSFLAFTRCPSPDCPDAPTESLGGSGRGQSPSIALGPAGVALVSYYHPVDQDLRTAYMRGWGRVDLSLAIGDAPDPVVPGQTLRYEFRASNASGTTASAVRVQAALPPGVTFVPPAVPGCTYAAATHTVECPGGTLAPGTTGVLVAAVEVLIPPLEPGPLTLTASIDTPEPDFDLTNNAANVQTTLGRWMAVEPALVVEGNSGTTAASFRVALHDTVPAGPAATVTFATSGGSATPGADYVAATGVITFAPGAPAQTVDVAVVGDTQVEGDESFAFQLSNPQGAAVLVSGAAGTIVDDDVAAMPFAGELAHGTSRWSDLTADGGAPGGTRHYRLAQAPFTSQEVVVDAASGDVQPLELARLAADGSTVLQSGTAGGTGAAVRLGWMNTGSAPSLTQLVRIHSGGCRAGCGPDDVYRIRAHDTTLRAPRFNNSGSQVTVLVLQNPTDRPIGGRAWFWSASGALVGSVSVSLGARETYVLDTSIAAPGASGSISIGHEGPYGAVVGKAVALEPATGLAFDTPVEVRPR